MVHNVYARRLFSTITGGLLIAVLNVLTVNIANAGDEISGKASNFTLTNAQGKQESLSDHLGEVVMVNFWASWCGPCREEMPVLDALYKKYNYLGFTILGINVEEDSNKAREMLKDIPVTFPILFDSKSVVSDLMAVDAMPTTVLIDRKGNKRFLHRGYKAGYENTYDQQIRSLVRE
ncbi:MAG: TlpA family protein disulfide reductase [Pseudomonadales bacterium]|nr:TlpA family protein disulfide reductase [Pseudomonadales bacterium]